MDAWQVGLEIIDNKVVIDNGHWNEKSRNTGIFLNGFSETQQNPGVDGFAGRRI